MPTTKQVRTWLCGSVLLLLFLLILALLLAPSLVDTDSFKQKFQTLVVEKTGGQLDYQVLSLAYWPRPAIELRKLTLNMPEQLQGRAETLRLVPEILPLLVGDLRLARLELQSPEFTLEQKEASSPESSETSYSYSFFGQNLAKALTPLRTLTPQLEFLINDGRVTVVRGKQQLIGAAGLTGRLAVSLESPDSATGTLQGRFSELSLFRQGRQEILKELELSGELLLTSNSIKISLENLAISAPGLSLSGTLSLTRTTPGMTLELTGSDIDVDAVRKTALALAGETSPAKEIFDYLRGGQVPRITFTTRGETLSELADLNNILIKGQLQHGAVSVPQIKLDLTDVTGDVLISDGVLQGSEVTTRLEGSTGHDGLLKVGLAEGNDLFQMELTLSADLAQSQKTLKRVVKDPEFVEEIDKITNLQGSAAGKLTLGDSLADIMAKVDLTSLNLTANYQGVPFPLALTDGLVSFAESRVVLKNLNGHFGQSDLSGLDCLLTWEQTTPKLDLSAGRLSLDLGELYPWLTSFSDTRAALQEISQLSGHLELASLTFKGAIDTPEHWQVVANGAVRSVSIDTPRFPDRINLTEGDFSFASDQLSFKALKASSHDALLSLNGRLKGFPKDIKQVELSFDGSMGQDSVAWLRDVLGLTASYKINTPLILSENEVTWQADSSSTFKGNVAIEKGPSLTLNILNLNEQFHLKSLIISDKYTDAEASYTRDHDGVSLSFTGSLRHETLDAIFLEHKFGQGRFEGDFSIQHLWGKHSAPISTGRLQGESLLIPLPSGDSISIEKVNLDGNGAQLNVEATTLSWNDRTWSPLKASITLSPGVTSANITEARMCQINFPGLLTFDGKTLSLDFDLNGKALDVASSYTCLTSGKVKMTGTLDFSGKFTFQGNPEALLSKVQGPLDMTFSNGVIEQSKVLARILEVLNVSEIVKGKLPDLKSNGFAYTTITVEGEFRDGKFVIEKLLMDGVTLDVIGSGEVDMVQENIDVELLAAPFKTVDTVIKNIPGVNYLLAGSLVTIPVSIKGPFAEPRVQIMSATSVGSSLLKLGERTIRSPLKLIETMMPAE